MKKETVTNAIKVCIPIILILMSVIITLCVNLTIKVYPAKYYSESGYIDFSAANTYTTGAKSGFYTYDENEQTVILDDNYELIYKSPYILKTHDGETFVSHSMIAWQVFGGTLYIAAIIYMCIVFKNT